MPPQEVEFSLMPVEFGLPSCRITYVGHVTLYSLPSCVMDCSLLVKFNSHLDTGPKLQPANPIATISNVRSKCNVPEKDARIDGEVC